MDIQKNRVISDGVNSEIPCLDCNYGRYECHCVTEEHTAYRVLTCDVCGHWDYYDRYIKSRMLVEQHIGSHLCEWRVCEQTGLMYMVRMPAAYEDVNMETLWWDEVTERLMEAGDDLESLRNLLVHAGSRMGILSEYIEFWDTVALSAETIREELSGWIDTYMGGEW